MKRFLPKFEDRLHVEQMNLSRLGRLHSWSERHLAQVPQLIGTTEDSQALLLKPVGIQFKFIAEDILESEKPFATRYQLL